MLEIIEIYKDWTPYVPHRFLGLLTLWSAQSVRRSTIRCFSSCCRSNGPNTVWTHFDSVVWLTIGMYYTVFSVQWCVWKQGSGLWYMNIFSIWRTCSVHLCWGFSVICEICLILVEFTNITKKLEGALAEEVKVKEPLNQQIHRMCLLRVKLMHFVNSLHNYIMTRVRQDGKTRY